MVARGDPVERILEGALSAVARFGLTKLSMVEVSSEAGVSRGTLYRYFSTKTELVDALGDHVQRDFERSLQRDVDGSDGDARIEAVLRAVTAYAHEHPSFDQILDVEPRFVKGFLRDRFPALTTTVAELLDPAAEPGDVHHLQAELILRVALSHLLTGPAKTPLDLPTASSLVASVEHAPAAAAPAARPRHTRTASAARKKATGKKATGRKADATGKTDTR